MNYVKIKAGLDWTGAPSLKEPHPYGPGIVAVENITDFELEFEETKKRLRIPPTQEVKGHQSRPEVLIAVLQMLMRIGANIGILLLDKGRAIAMEEQWPEPNELRHNTAIYLTKLFIEKTQEISNFRTDILRCNQFVCPGRKMKVALWPSHKSTLIQCADIVTYVAARSLRPDGLTPELRRLWQVLLQSPRIMYVLMYNWGE